MCIMYYKGRSQVHTNPKLKSVFFLSEDHKTRFHMCSYDRFLLAKVLFVKFLLWNAELQSYNYNNWNVPFFVIINKVILLLRMDFCLQNSRIWSWLFSWNVHGYPKKATSYINSLKWSFLYSKSKDVGPYLDSSIIDWGHNLTKNIYSYHWLLHLD